MPAPPVILARRPRRLPRPFANCWRPSSSLSVATGARSTPVSALSRRSATGTNRSERTMTVADRRADAAASAASAATSALSWSDPGPRPSAVPLMASRASTAARRSPISSSRRPYVRRKRSTTSRGSSPMRRGNTTSRAPRKSTTYCPTRGRSRTRRRGCWSISRDIPASSSPPRRSRASRSDAKVNGRGRVEALRCAITPSRTCLRRRAASRRSSAAKKAAILDCTRCASATDRSSGSSRSSKNRRAAVAGLVPRRTGRCPTSSPPILTSTTNKTSCPVPVINPASKDAVELAGGSEDKDAR